MTHGQAQQNGFSYFWFEEKNPNFRIDKAQAYVVDAQGDPQAVFQLAETVKWQASHPNAGIILMLVAVVVIIWSFVRHKRNRT